MNQKPPSGNKPVPQQRRRPSNRPDRPNRPNRSGRPSNTWPERAPRLPADGIKAKSQDGEFGETWWAKRWVGVLEGFGYGNRLTRGRTYARDGAVLNLDIRPGHVSAKVQGSRPAPYKVTIAINPLSDKQWEQAVEAMAGQALFTAKLLAGEMPQEIEQAFASARVPLFPRSSRDITTNCSCPDYANPCKHIAAAYYLLGERFDEDPFLIFELRGRTKQQVIEALRARRAATVGSGGSKKALPPADEGPRLADMLDRFDTPGPELARVTPQIAPPPMASPILRRYGPSPGESTNALHTLYVTISKRLLERMFASDV